MIRKIVLENFMSHKRTVIEPAEGLTVLAGPNNCGKSAVVVALQTLCFNDRGSKAYVRHGEKEARVRVETDDGHRLEWIRRGDVVSYKIDGRDVNRLKGGVPEDLHALLRLGKVEDASGDFEFDIHFAEQKSPIFLLDQPGSRAATFFAASSDAGLLLQMQQRHKDREREVRGQERTLQANVAEARREMQRYDAIPRLQDLLKKADTQHQDVTARLTSARALALGMIEREDAENKVRLQAEVCAKLKALTATPATHDEKSLREQCAKLKERQHQAVQAQARLAAVGSLGTRPDTTDEAPLQDTVRRLQDRQSRVRAMTARTKELAKLQQPPTLADDEAIAQLYAVIARKKVHAALLASKLAVAAKAAAPPDLLETGPITHLAQRIAAHLAEVSARAKEFADAEQELQTMAGTIRTFVTKHPVCPLCGSTLKAEQILTGRGQAHA